jgi:hypothetical protein
MMVREESLLGFDEDITGAALIETIYYMQLGGRCPVLAAK